MLNLKAIFPQVYDAVEETMSLDDDNPDKELMLERAKEICADLPKDAPTISDLIVLMDDRARKGKWVERMVIPLEDRAFALACERYYNGVLFKQFSAVMVGEAMSRFQRLKDMDLIINSILVEMLELAVTTWALPEDVEGFENFGKPSSWKQANISRWEREMSRHIELEDHSKIRIEISFDRKTGTANILIRIEASWLKERFIINYSQPALASLTSLMSLPAVVFDRLYWTLQDILDKYRKKMYPS